MTDREIAIAVLREQAEEIAKLDAKRESVVASRNEMIRKARTLGVSGVEMSDATGLSRQTIYNILDPDGGVQVFDEMV